MAEGALPGLSLALAYDGTRSQALVLGVADPHSGRPVTPTTAFRAASTSKLLTALVLGRLHDRGVLDLASTAERYLPWLPARTGRALVLLDLLAHRSGLPRGAYGHAWDRPGTAAVAEQRIGPIGAHKYSNAAYAVLEHVVEAATTRSFVEVARAEVLEPLGLPAELSDTVGPAEAAVGTMGGPEPWDPPRPGAPLHAARILGLPLAAGGLWCTPSVLATLLLELVRPTASFLRPSTRALLTAQFGDAKSAKGPTLAKSWTPALQTSRWAGLRRLGHQGSYAGFSAAAVAIPEAGAAVVAMTNRESAGWSLQRVLSEALRRLPGVPSGRLGVGGSRVGGSLEGGRPWGRYCCAGQPPLELHAMTGDRLQGALGGQAFAAARVGPRLFFVAEGAGAGVFLLVEPGSGGGPGLVTHGDHTWCAEGTPGFDPSPPSVLALCGRFECERLRSAWITPRGDRARLQLGAATSVDIHWDEANGPWMVNGPFAGEPVNTSSPGGGLTPLSGEQQNELELGGHRFVRRTLL